MSAISDERLAEMQARCDAATPGPWFTEETPRSQNGWPTCSVVAATYRKQNVYVAFGGVAPEANRRFIAAARTDVPDLIAEVRRQEAALAEIAALHQPAKLEFDSFIEVCLTCCCGGDIFRTTTCTREHDHGAGKPICATAAAIQQAREK